MKTAKLWHRQYAATLLLFLCVFYACVFFLSQSSFLSAFRSETQAVVREHAMIARSIWIEQAALQSRGGTSEAAEQAIAAEYGAYYGRRGMYLCYFDAAGKALYSNMPEGLMPERADAGILQTAPDGKGVRYFLLTGPAGTGFLSYAREAETLLDGQRRYSLLLVGVAALFALSMALGLYVMLRRVYRPMDRLAHELRTPLTAIHGYAQYIALGALNEEERLEAARFIEAESGRLRGVADTLLSLSTLRYGEASMERIRVAALFQRVSKIYPQLHTTVKTPFITGDAALLESLLINLVDNAVHASPEGMSIELIARENRFFVLDRGTGMDEAACRRLNDPGAGGAPSGKGTGLGIPLCHEIAAMHRAKLRFYVRDGGGCVARLEFLQSSDNSKMKWKQRYGSMGKKGKENPS